MRLPTAFTYWLQGALRPDRKPDVIIGGEHDPYLWRWHLIPRNPVFNVYLHLFLRSDDDRALHDHPWWSLGVLLIGDYLEEVPALHDEDRVSPQQAAALRLTHHVHRKAGQVIFRRAASFHRVELLQDSHGREKPVWTLFMTGPRFREWGFACPKGFRHWREFTKQLPGGVSEVGRGCD